MKKFTITTSVVLVIALLAGSVLAGITITDTSNGRSVSAANIWTALQAFFGGGITGAAVAGAIVDISEDPTAPVINGLFDYPLSYTDVDAEFIFTGDTAARVAWSGMGGNKEYHFIEDLSGLSTDVIGFDFDQDGFCELVGDFGAGRLAGDADGNCAFNVGDLTLIAGAWAFDGYMGDYASTPTTHEFSVDDLTAFDPPSDTDVYFNGVLSDTINFVAAPPVVPVVAKLAPPVMGIGGQVDPVVGVSLSDNFVIAVMGSDLDAAGLGCELDVPGFGTLMGDWIVTFPEKTMAACEFDVSGLTNKENFFGVGFEVFDTSGPIASGTIDQFGIPGEHGPYGVNVWIDATSVIDAKFQKAAFGGNFVPQAPITGVSEWFVYEPTDFVSSNYFDDSATNTCSPKGNGLTCAGISLSGALEEKNYNNGPNKFTHAISYGSTPVDLNDVGDNNILTVGGIYETAAGNDGWYVCTGEDEDLTVGITSLDCGADNDLFIS